MPCTTISGLLRESEAIRSNRARQSGEARAAPDDNEPRILRVNADSRNLRFDHETSRSPGLANYRRDRRDRRSVGQKRKTGAAAPTHVRLEPKFPAQALEQRRQRDEFFERSPLHVVKE